jgi:hypothetical protein
MALTTNPGPVPCSTGSWSQKWNCGWNQPTTGAAHAGYVFGHDIVPLLLIAAIIISVAVASRRRSTTGARTRPRARKPRARTWNAR